MTFSEMQSRLDSRIKGHGNLTWSLTDKKRYLNDGYTEFARLTHYLRKQSTVTITADDALYAFPTVTGVASALKVFRADWDGTVLTPRSTRWMDTYIGTDWRDAEGATLSYILTDTEDVAQIRVYPMIDTAANVGSKVLTIEYSYIPSDMTSDSDTCALGETYSVAPVEYAVWMCLEDAVQSKQNPGMGDRAYMRFKSLVGSARAEVNAGLFHHHNRHITPQTF